MMWIRNVAKRAYSGFDNSIAILKWRSKSVDIGANSLVRNACFGKNVSIGRHCNVQNAVINDYSYMGDNCCLPLCEIDSFCSIANGVCLGGGNHPKEFVSTSPYTYIGDGLREHGALNPCCVFDEEYGRLANGKKQICSIGADVWIGTNAVLVSGAKPLRIGVGSIIAAGAVVVRDVEPYSIVAGVPAKKIGMRFSESQIEGLLKTSWWTEDKDVLIEKMHLMDDVDAFIDSFKGQH